MAIVRAACHWHFLNNGSHGTVALSCVPLTMGQGDQLYLHETSALAYLPSVKSNYLKQHDSQILRHYVIYNWICIFRNLWSILWILFKYKLYWVLTKNTELNSLTTRGAEVWCMIQWMFTHHFSLNFGSVLAHPPISLTVEFIFKCTRVRGPARHHCLVTRATGTASWQKARERGKVHTAFSPCSAAALT